MARTGEVAYSKACEQTAWGVWYPCAFGCYITASLVCHHHHRCQLSQVTSRMLPQAGHVPILVVFQFATPLLLALAKRLHLALDFAEPMPRVDEIALGRQQLCFERLNKVRDAQMNIAFCISMQTEWLVDVMTCLVRVCVCIRAVDEVPRAPCDRHQWWILCPLYAVARGPSLALRVARRAWLSPGPPGL